MTDARLDSCLREFDTITLDQMDRVKLMDRVDTKFNFSRTELIGILPELQEHYQILSINNNVRPSYESLYFDDEDLTFYHEHHRKRLNRYKVRIRKYLDSDMSFLEVKHKFKGRTNKQRIRINDIRGNLTPEELDFISGTGISNPELVPVLTNTYQRLTLVGKRLDERLTIDLRLTFSKDQQRYAFEELVIAELKQKKVSRQSPFFQVMKKRSIRPFRLSKYCIGVIKTFGQDHVKYNRFKNKLLKINKIDVNAI